MIMKNLFKEGVDCPLPKSVRYAVSVVVLLCFLSFKIMKYLFKEDVDCPRSKSVRYAVSVVVPLCFLKLCGLLLDMDTWMLETCLKLLLKVVLAAVVAEYLIIADNAKNSIPNTRKINFRKAFSRFAASFILFVVYSNITGPLFVQLWRSRTIATAANQLAIFRSGKELTPTNYYLDPELL